jgi:hypothetical protein
MTEKAPPSGTGRFDLAIGVLAFAGYVLERFLVFLFLRSRTGGEWESGLLELFFGKAPYSVLNVVLGFSPPEAIWELLTPVALGRALLQVLHFLANWWLASLPFRAYARWRDRGRGGPLPDGRQRIV